MGRRYVKAGVLLLSPLVAYLLVANALVMTPLLQWIVNRDPAKFLMTYERAYTLWPGAVYVRDFHLAYEAYDIAFELEIGEAHADVVLSALLKRRFHATNVRAKGVAYSLQDKVDPEFLGDPRPRAFPRLTGLTPFRYGPKPNPNEPPPPPNTWAVQLDGVDAEVSELWILEFRWRGHGRARGAFELKTQRQFWVGPATLELEPGLLTVGDAVVSRDFGGEALTIIAPTEVVRRRKLRMLRGLTVDGQFHMHIEELAFLRAYGLTATGLGEFSLDAHVLEGVVTPQSQASLTVPHVRVHQDETGGGFEGTAKVRAWCTDRPWAEAEAAGVLTLPLPNAQRLEVEIPLAEGVMRLTANDFVASPRFDVFELTAADVSVVDTGPLRAAMKGHLPWVVPIVLGTAPLTAQGVELSGTLRRLQLSVDEARVGETTVRGQLGFLGQPPSGALEAHVKAMGVGIVLDEGKASFQMLVEPGWLERQAEARRARRPPPAR